MSIVAEGVRHVAEPRFVCTPQHWSTSMLPPVQPRPLLQSRGDAAPASAAFVSGAWKSSRPRAIPYDGVLVNAGELPVDPEQFSERLQHSLQVWRDRPGLMRFVSWQVKLFLYKRST